MKKAIDQTLAMLNQGKVILYPTDTIWGIGCDATSEPAIRRILEIKKRGSEKGLIVLVNSTEMLAAFVPEIPVNLHPFLESPDRPTTIIYPRVKGLPAPLYAPDGSLAIRLTRDPFCSELIRLSGRPLVSTSANVSGDEPPASFADIHAGLLKEVDFVVPWRQEENSPAQPSRIIKVLPGYRISMIRK